MAPLVAAELTAILGDRHVLEAHNLAQSSPCWHTHNLRATRLVRPKTTDEVAGVLKLCHERGQPVVPQAGLTGLVQGTGTSPGDLSL